MRLALLIGTLVLGVPGVLTALVTRADAAEAAEAPSAPKRVGIVLTTQKSLPKAAREVETALADEKTLELSAHESSVEYDDIASEARRILEETGSDALIVVGTSVEKKGKALEIRVFDADGARLVETIVLRAKNDALLGETLREDPQLREALGRVRGRAKTVEAPPEKAPEPEPVVEAERPASEVADTSTTRLPTFAVFVAAKAYSRSFVYTNSLSELFGSGYDALPSYSLPMAPMPHVSAELLPWGSSSSLFAGLGLAADGEFDAFTSLSYRGSVLSQTHYRFSVGPVYKLPLGSWILAAEGRFGRHAFSIDGDRTVSGEDAFPSVAYSMIEAGLGVEYVGVTTRLGVRAAHLALLGLGDIGSAAWFPSAHGRGLALGAFLSRSLSNAWAVRVGIDARVLGLDFNPIDPTTPQSRVAGGATDQYLGLTVGLELRMFGESAVAAAPQKPAKKGDFDDFE